MYPHPENSISRPIAWQERGVYFTPMQDGLRAGGVVELGGNSSEISSKVVSYLKRATEAVFPNINNHLSEWVGFRPSVPDSLPVIGQSKKNPYIYYCFGHQHIGWSLQRLISLRRMKKLTQMYLQFITLMKSEMLVDQR